MLFPALHRKSKAPREGYEKGTFYFYFSVRGYPFTAFFGEKR